jgi:hypothetical protein
MTGAIKVSSFAFVARSTPRRRWVTGELAPAAQGALAMPNFILDANILLYKKRLQQATDPKKIEMIQTLLADAETKLAAWKAEKATG